MSALDVLHDDRHLLALGDDVEDLHHVRMAERRPDLGLAIEPARHVGPYVGMHALEGDLAAESLVLRENYHGHAARAEAPNEAAAAGYDLAASPCSLERSPPAPDRAIPLDGYDEGDKPSTEEEARWRLASPLRARERLVTRPDRPDAAETDTVLRPLYARAARVCRCAVARSSVPWRAVCGFCL